jgi:hypothetical protein
MYTTTSSFSNTLVVSQYLGVCTVSETAGKHILLTRNDGVSAYHLAHEFTEVKVNDAVSFTTRRGKVLVGKVVTVDVEAGEVELVLASGKRGWADAHAVKSVLARNVVNAA